MRTPLDTLIDALDAKPAGGGYIARCPAHDDANPSLSITESGGKLLVNCHAGCSFADVESALAERNISLRDDSDDDWQRDQAWAIRGETGKVLAQHVRVDKPDGSKIVFWRGPYGEKTTLTELKLKTRDLPLYGTELLPGRTLELVVITEGEKAADAARSIGLLALGTSTGASNAPSPKALEPLRGRAVVLWPDNDAEGWKHMRKVERNLAGIASSAAWFNWPLAPPKGDAADFVALGGDLEVFMALRESSSPSGPPSDHSPLKDSPSKPLPGAGGHGGGPTSPEVAPESPEGPIRPSRDAPAPVREPLISLKDATVGALDELDRYAAGDFSRYVTTGLRDLDRALGGGLRRGAVTLIGAPTGAGKTTILASFGMAAARNHPVLLVSPEMSPAEIAEREIIRRAELAKWERNPWVKRTLREQAEGEHIRVGAEIMTEDLPLYIYNAQSLEMDDIFYETEQAKKRNPDLALVLLDYAQMFIDADPRKARYLSVGEVATRAVHLSLELDVAVVIASQVNTLKAKGSATTYTFRESQILEHKSTTVMLFLIEYFQEEEHVLQQAKYPTIERSYFRATKNRTGRLFTTDVLYRPALFRLDDLAQGEG